MDLSTDRNMLVGILACQMGFVERDQFIEGVREWSADQSEPIEKVLLRRNAISQSSSELLVAMVEQQLKTQGGDLSKCLQLLSSVESLREELQSLQDAAIDRTLTILPNENAIPSSTSPISVGESSAGGTRFKVLRPHAKGGLGQVSVALDSELNREVALKEIQSVRADDDESRSRFVREAEITGGLEHPGIVPVYGLGQAANGRPFYAMRFIRGDSLEEAISRYHTSTSDDPEDANLEFRQLLRRFVDVCNAIEYAHSRGVLHRDLKPGNVMLGRYGETLVVDWGLAKAAGGTDNEAADGETALQPASGENSAATVMGHAIGTPAYMPPEQAAGQLDELGPASDVYSLGATLYCLLTGQPPFKGGGLQEVLKRVEQGDFRPPCVIREDAPKPLDAICRRAMATRPADRYASPAELSADIERFLADEPVSAYEEPFLVKARRSMRKHKTLVATLATLFMVSLAALGVTTFIVSGKNAELVKANLALESANKSESKARLLAEKNEQSARDQSELALTTLTSVIRDIQGGLKELSGAGEIRRQLLKTSLAKLESVSSAFVADAKVDQQTIKALLEIGDVVLEFGAATAPTPSSSDSSPDTERVSAVGLAGEYFERANAIARQLVEENGDAGRRDLAMTFGKLGRVYALTGQSQKSLQAHRECLVNFQELVSAQPDSTQAQRDVAEAHSNMADLQMSLGNSAEALASYEAAHQFRERLAQGDAEDENTQRLLAVSKNKLGDIQLRRGDSKLALQFYEASQEIFQQLVSRHPENRVGQRNLAVVCFRVGDLQVQAGDLQAALKSFLRGQTVFANLAEADRANDQAQKDLAVAYEKLGGLHLMNGEGAKAVGAYRDSLKIRQTQADADPNNVLMQRDLSVSYITLGDALNRVGDAEGALNARQRSLEITEKIATADQTNARAQRDLAVALSRFGQMRSANNPKAALPLMERALKIHRQLAEDDADSVQNRQDLASQLSSIGATRRRMRDFEGALKVYSESLAIRAALAADDPSNPTYRADLSLTHNGIGDLHAVVGRSEEARSAYNEGLALRAKLANDFPMNPIMQRDHMMSHYKLAELAMSLEDFDVATEEYQMSADILRGMIEKNLNVESAKSELQHVENLRRRAAMSGIALGDWDALLKQPLDAQPEYLELRAIASCDRGRFEDAAVAAERLVELESADKDHLYNAACAFGRCAASIAPKQDSPLSAAQEKRRAEWIDSALSALAKSIDKGWDDMAHLQQDSDLAPLRNRQEFKKLIESKSSGNDER